MDTYPKVSRATADQIKSALLNKALDERNQGLKLSELGLDDNDVLIQGKRVTKQSTDRLRKFMSTDTELSGLDTRETIHLTDLFTRCFSDGGNSPAVTPSVSAPKMSAAGASAPADASAVSVVSHKNGIFGYAKEHINGKKPFGTVCSIDSGGSLSFPLGIAFKREFGDSYAQWSKKNIPFVGCCNTYQPARDSSTMKDCMAVHNVLVEHANAHDFKEKLITVLEGVLSQAHEKGIYTVLCPLLGCGQGGGAGDVLAEALVEARKNVRIQPVPQLIFVGMEGNTNDTKNLSALRNRLQTHDSGLLQADKSKAVHQSHPQTQPVAVARTASADQSAKPAQSVASDGVTPLTHRLEIALSPNGVFGIARGDSGTVMVIPQNGRFSNFGGVARQVKQESGVDAEELAVSRGLKGEVGEVMVTGTGNYATDSKHRMQSCMHLFHVVGADKVSYAQSNKVDKDKVELTAVEQKKFENDYEKVFYNILMEGINCRAEKIVCPFIGCGSYARASAEDMAHAHWNAYLKVGRDLEKYGLAPRRVKWAIIPKLILTGNSGDQHDRTIHDEFKAAYNKILDKAEVDEAKAKEVPPVPSRDIGSQRREAHRAFAAKKAAAAAKQNTGEFMRYDIVPGKVELIDGIGLKDGIFQYGQMLSDQKQKFSYVNAANDDMQHGGGIAKVFLDKAGAEFNRDTLDAVSKAKNAKKPIKAGDCFTCPPYKIQDKTPGCVCIHNSVAPIKSNFTTNGQFTNEAAKREYEKQFRDTFINMIKDANQNKVDRIVCCFIGCAIFKGEGENLYKALMDAIEDLEGKRVKIPLITLVGTYSDGDEEVASDFREAYKTAKGVTLVGSKGSLPVHAPVSGNAASNRAQLPSDGSYEAQGARPKTRAHARATTQSGAVGTPSPLTIQKTKVKGLVRVTLDDFESPAVKHYGYAGVLDYCKARFEDDSIKHDYSLVNAIVQKDSEEIAETIKKSEITREANLDVEGELKKNSATFETDRMFVSDPGELKARQDNQCQNIYTVIFKHNDPEDTVSQIVKLLMLARGKKRVIIPENKIGISAHQLKDVLTKVLETIPEVQPEGQSLNIAQLIATKKNKQNLLPEIHIVHDLSDTPSPAAENGATGGEPKSIDAAVVNTQKNISGTEKVEEQLKTEEKVKQASASSNEDVVLDDYKEGISQLLDQDGGPLDSEKNKIVMNLVKKGQFTVVKSFPSEMLKDDQFETITMDGWKKFNKYGQILSYVVDKKTYYLLSESVGGIVQANNGTFVCPNTNKSFGIKRGNQPEGGTMNVYTEKKSLAGYPNCGRIKIAYHFDSGVQADNHPTPGNWYNGIDRSAYLPDNKEGREVLAMLKLAFENRLTFTIGDSRTSGKKGVITWNDIHHKTDPRPNEQFGYPDPTYLDRVKEELAAKGITPADIPKDKVNYDHIYDNS